MVDNMNRRYRCNDAQFGCIDILPLSYHDTAIYLTVR